MKLSRWKSKDGTLGEKNKGAYLIFQVRYFFLGKKKQTGEFETDIKWRKGGWWIIIPTSRL